MSLERLEAADAVANLQFAERVSVHASEAGIVKLQFHRGAEIFGGAVLSPDAAARLAAALLRAAEVARHGQLADGSLN